jgi:hypothetical protein
MKFHISVFFDNSLRKIHVSLKSGENNGYFKRSTYIYNIRLLSS